MGLQDYQIETSNGSPLFAAALAKLKASPAVQTAFDKVAHRLKLPMANTYWAY